MTRSRCWRGSRDTSNSRCYARGLPTSHGSTEDRSGTDLLDLAIDAYAATPLTVDTWYAVGTESWQRAFDLLGRRGKDGQARINKMRSALTEKVLSSTIE